VGLSGEWTGPAAHVKTAFEHWEKTGDDLYFRVKSTVYSGKIDWDSTKTGITPLTKFQGRLQEGRIRYFRPTNWTDDPVTWQHNTLK
jgi:hypothetical protein